MPTEKLGDLTFVVQDPVQSCFECKHIRDEREAGGMYAKCGVFGGRYCGQTRGMATCPGFERREPPAGWLRRFCRWVW